MAKRVIRRSPSYGRKKQSSWRRYVLVLLLLILALVAYVAYSLGFARVGRNTETVYLLVGKQTTWSELREQIQTKVWPNQSWLLDLYAKYVGVESGLRPGRYAVTPELSTTEMFRVLLTGTQTPVELDLRGLRTEQDLVKAITGRLMMTEQELRSALYDSAFLAKHKLDTESVRSLFFAKQYSINWNVSPQGFVDTLMLHHKHFWNDERMSRVQALGITPAQASAFAAILEEESNKTDEYGQIARLYLNRYRIGMMLQSDPTVKYALGKFDIRRVKGEHLKVSSPYNTYQVVGITPGPIRIPKTSTIDSVLNAPEHKYLYMCAKEDFSGYHNFAVDFGTHQRNARLYQKALNERNIK